MALKNKPYLPLYVDDFLTDEKLLECSAEATGVYIRIMCILHCSEEYGKLRLKEKDKQKFINISAKSKHEYNKIKIFAFKLSKLITFTENEIYNALVELVEEGVMKIEGDCLIQERMVRDDELSKKRAKAGAKGGSKTQRKAFLFKQLCYN